LKPVVTKLLALVSVVVLLALVERVVFRSVTTSLTSSDLHLPERLDNEFLPWNISDTWATPSCKEYTVYSIYTYKTCFSRFGSEASGETYFVYYYYGPRPLFSFSRLMSSNSSYLNENYFFGLTSGKMQAGKVYLSGQWERINQLSGDDRRLDRESGGNGWKLVNRGAWENANSK